MSNNGSSIGTLSISVQTMSSINPISNAKVSIFRSDKSVVMTGLNTDSSGQTTVVELGTPPFEYSQVPDGGKPYSEYTVRVEAPGFESVNVDGVQVLPDTLALQRVRMRQLLPDTSIGPTTIDIEQHTLWGVFPPKIPEDEVKPLPESNGYVVLSQPVIPEFIVVHLGRPTDTSAQNVWVPFKDYVKNVASCEIFPTWPKETIKANVLAILSFVLNRVYTEWYRGKGYGFTITNSTAYDQAFSYGRNYFDDISVVVDDIFTSYITRPGIRQPLFTQFCDGVRTKCPNAMEQWGSKDLGDQGLDALSILRTYYGSTIYLAQAEKVQGVPMSFPGEVLQIGSTGNSVRTIQEQLNSISNHYPLIPKQRVDGVYGPQTAEAVRIYQQTFNLPVTGSVDFGTWYAISNTYVGVNRFSETVL